MKIITFIASHLDCKERLSNFLQLIDNIKEQIDYYEKIELSASISHGNFISKQELLHVLGLTNQYNFKYYVHEEKQSQFMHYKFLTSTLHYNDDENTWILFSDDDDEWANNRLGIYQYLLENINNDDYHLTTSICYASKNVPMINYIGTYVDYCVKLKYLKIFFDNTHEQQLNNKYCDSYFVKYIRYYGKGILKIAYCTDDTILYNWTKHNYYEYDNNIENIEINKKLIESNLIKKTINSNEDWKTLILNDLDLFMAQYYVQNVKEWMNFCNIYSDGKIYNNQISKEIIKQIIKIF